MTSQFLHMMLLSDFFGVFFFLVKVSFLSKCHVNIIICSGVMRFSFYKELTKNLEIGNIPVWVLPNIWRLGQLKNIKLVTNGSNKILLNASKCYCCSFCRFWVIKGRPTGGVKLPPTQIRFNSIASY